MTPVSSLLWQLFDPSPFPCQLLPFLRHSKKTQDSLKTLKASLPCSFCAHASSSLPSLSLLRPSSLRIIVPSSLKPRSLVCPIPLRLHFVIADCHSQMTAQIQAQNALHITMRPWPSPFTSSHRYGSPQHSYRMTRKAKRCGRKFLVTYQISRLKASSMEAPSTSLTIP